MLETVTGVARLTPNSDQDKSGGRGWIRTRTRTRLGRCERTRQGRGAGKAGTWSGQGRNVALRRNSC